MDLANWINTLSELKLSKIFFYRICGTGMGACACLAKESGFEVAGADISYSPPMSTYLEQSGIKLWDLDEVDDALLQEYDLIIVGNSVPRDSSHARQIEKCGVPFTSFPSFLGELILKNKNVIGLAGTHGKTTTTYFLSQILESLKQDSGYFIGGIIDERPPSRLGQGYFAIESDEYDSAYFEKISKFRLYELDHMILTSLEFDHADIFEDIEDIKDEFRAILKDFKGVIIANDDYPAILELQKEFPNLHWTLYGENTVAGPTNIQSTHEGSFFELRLKGRVSSFQTNMVGKHNILNVASCVLLLSHLGFEVKDLQTAVAKLKLVKRRQEERGHYRGALVIDDFAHHPKAITLTLAGLRTKYPKKKILTVFEPISATARSSIFQREFADSLALSDQVILAMNPMKTTVKGAENLSGDQIVEDLATKDVLGIAVNNLADLQRTIDDKVDKDTLLVILSNRTCLGLWESAFVKDLS